MDHDDSDGDNDLYFEMFSGDHYSLEELAEGYDLPVIVDLFNERAQDVVVMDFKGLGIDALGIHNRDCAVKFFFRDDIPAGEEGKTLRGFELTLVDAYTGDVYLSSLHAKAERDAPSFSIDGGAINTQFNRLAGSLMDIEPVDIMRMLSHSRPRDDQPPIVKPTVN